jgi:hypothetical protein
VWWWLWWRLSRGRRIKEKRYGRTRNRINIAVITFGGICALLTFFFVSFLKDAFVI